jgi:hypothetical protein
MIPEALPEGTVQTPPVAVYISEDSRADLYYITIALYPDDSIYLLHWCDNYKIPTYRRKVVEISTGDRSATCELENGGGPITFNRLASGDIVNLDLDTIAFHSDMGFELFHMTRNAEFNKLAVLFPDRVVPRTRKGSAEERKAEGTAPRA